MSEGQLFIGIDSGTQGTKAVVFSRELGKIIAEAYAEHHIIESQEGRREQEPGWWIEASTAVIGKVLKESNVSKQLIRAIGVSGQQHGMVALDLDGNVIRPAKLWCDTETSQQCIEITQEIGSSEKIIELIGNSIAAGFTASKILWLKNHEPENFLISRAMIRTGAVDFITEKVLHFSRGDRNVAVAIVLLVVACASAFINNTPVLVLFIPIVFGLSCDYDLSPSKLLIPVSYASILAEWFHSVEYEERLGTLAPLPNRAFVNALFVDLTDTLPDPEEARRLREALDGRADAGPLRSVLGLHSIS